MSRQIFTACALALGLLAGAFLGRERPSLAQPGREDGPYRLVFRDDVLFRIDTRDGRTWRAFGAMQHWSEVQDGASSAPVADEHNALWEPVPAALISLLKDASNHRPVEAMEILTLLGQRPVPQLVAAIEEEFSRAPGALTLALEVLGAIGTEARSAIPVLVRLLEHKNSDVADAALDTLLSVTRDETGGLRPF